MVLLVLVMCAQAEASACAHITNTNNTTGEKRKMPVTEGDCNALSAEAASYFDMVISAIS